MTFFLLYTRMSVSQWCITDFLWFPHPNMPRKMIQWFCCLNIYFLALNISFLLTRYYYTFHLSLSGQMWNFDGYDPSRDWKWQWISFSELVLTCLMSHKKHTLVYIYVCMYTAAERNLYAFCCKSSSIQYTFSWSMFKFLLAFSVKKTNR